MKKRPAQADPVAGFVAVDEPFWTKGGLRAYRHEATGIVFRRVRGGEVTVGLIAQHEQLARALEDPPSITISEVQPSYKKTIEEMLVSALPLSEIELARVDSKQKLHAPRAVPARLEFEVAVRIAKRLGCRLPTEPEWEYLCRGGSDSLFVWGDKLPAKAVLERWLASDFNRLKQFRSNGFGLYCLFYGEWTGDEYKKSHAPFERSQKGVHVVKGGAAFFWPWQDDSAWIWALPCIRMPSTDLLEDRCASVRFVFPLG